MLKQIMTRNKKLIAIILAIIVFALVPLYVTSPYHLDLLIAVIVHAVLAITFIMCLRTGMINMGISAFWGIGAYASALLVMKLNMSFWLSLPLTILITGIIAVIFGYILIGSGSTGFAFVILSSVIGMLFSTAVGSIDYVGGYAGIRNIPAPNPISLPFLPPIEFSVVDKIPFYYLALSLFIIIVLVIKALFASRVGRAWKAIGLNAQLGGSIGINIFGYKMAVFVVSSAIAGLIGAFFAHYMGFVTPDAYGMWVNIYVQVYAILGGIGYIILGPIIGSTLMTILPESLRQIQDFAPIVLGTLLILLILFLPNGLMGVVDSLRGFINKRYNGNSAIGEKSAKSDITS
jgi:branched-chain amino acid transport system permease protein